MTEYLIRPRRDRAEYVLWCTDTRAPLTAGDRDHVADWLRWHRGSMTVPLMPEVIAWRLACADRHGTSAHDPGGYGCWGEELFAVAGGYVRRADLYPYAVAVLDGRADDALTHIAAGEAVQGTIELPENLAPGSASPTAPAPSRRTGSVPASG